MQILINSLAAMNNHIARILMVFTSLIVLVIFLIVFGGVVVRTFTGQGYGIALEMPPLLVPWMVFPLLGLLLRSGAHITVDYLPTKLTQNGQSKLRVAVAIVAVFAGAIFCRAGIKAVELFQLTGQMAEVELEFPIWWIYLSFPVGYVIMVSFALEIVLTEITGTPKNDKPQEYRAEL